MGRLAFSALDAPHLAYRQSIGFPKWAAKDTFHALLDAGIPSVHLFSEAVIPRPSD